MESEQQPEKTGPAPENFSLDIEGASGAIGISRDIYLRILDKAVAQTTGDLQQMEAAFGCEDIDSIQSISHRLKGDYDNLHITELSAPARELNNEAKTQKNKEKMRDIFIRLKAKFGELCRFIDRIK